MPRGKRSSITRDLHTKKYRQRVVPDKRAEEDRKAARRPIKKEQTDEEG